MLPLVLLCRITVAEYDDLSEFENSEIPDESGYDDLAKRVSSFVRIGRPKNSFVRIGKSPSLKDVYEAIKEESGDDDGEESSALNSYASSDFENPFKRAHSFVRIGRQPYYGPDEVKRGGAFVRMGKFPSSAYLRSMGRVHQIVPQPYYTRTGRIGHSFIRIGKRDTSDALQNVLDDNLNIPIDDNQDEKEKEILQKYLMLGEEMDNLREGLYDNPDKRMSSFVRIGRSHPLERAMILPGKLREKINVYA